MSVAVFHDIQQNSKGWFILRRGRVTASEFKVLMQKQETAGYRELVRRCAAIMRGEEYNGRPVVKSRWMMRGNRLEPFARELYRREFLFLKGVRNGGFFEYGDFFGCSPDGLVGLDGLVEIKCPSYKVFCEYRDSGELPNEYKWQVHGQMLVTNRKWCDFVAYYEDDRGQNVEISVVRIYRSDEMDIELLTRFRQFEDDVERELKLVA